MEEIAVENGRISDFRGFVSLTWTLDRVILHTVMHHSSTSTYTPNFIEIEETLWTDGRTGGRTFLRPTLLGRLRGVDLIRDIHSAAIWESAWCLMLWVANGLDAACAGADDDIPQGRRDRMRSDLVALTAFAGALPHGIVGLQHDINGRWSNRECRTVT